MLTRPITHDYNLKQIWRLHPKFNDALESILNIEKYMHIITIHSMEEDKYFDACGNLTNAGKQAYWRQLNEEVKKLDHSLADLQRKQTQKKKLPTPPPHRRY